MESSHEKRSRETDRQEEDPQLEDWNEEDDKEEVSGPCAGTHPRSRRPEGRSEPWSGRERARFCLQAGPASPIASGLSGPG